MRVAESVVQTLPKVGGRQRQPLQDSAREGMACVASFDIMKLRKLLAESEHQRGCELLAAVVSMLTKMV